MRIIKPNKPSGSRSTSDLLSERNGEPDGLIYEDVKFNGKEPVKQPKRALNTKDNDAARTKQVSPSSEQNDLSEQRKEFNTLLAKGIRLLAMREHSEQEIFTKLSSKSDSIDVVTEVIEELKNAKYLSNDRFTEMFVRSKSNKGHGPSKIRSDLKGKGIKTSMIDEYLDSAAYVWYENAQTLYSKKYGDQPITDYNTWAKRARFMQSRGFTMEQIQVAVPPVEHD